MPAPIDQYVPPFRKEDRDAVGASSKRVANIGPPAVRAFASTKEGREERQQLAQERLAERQNRPPPHQNLRGGYRGRGGAVRGGRPGWKAMGNVPAEGEAGPSTWAMQGGSGSSHHRPIPQQPHRAHAPFIAPPAAAVAGYTPHMMSAPSIGNRPSPMPSPALRSPSGIAPNPTAVQPVTTPAPSSQTVGTQVAQPVPGAKLVFRPTKRPTLPAKSGSTAPLDLAPSERAIDQDEGLSKEENHRGEAGKTAKQVEDKKPTKAELEYTPIDPDTQMAGTLAFRKGDIPPSCFTDPGKGRVQARQQFRQQQYNLLRQEGKTATHCMWRDDGFAVDWERAAEATVQLVPDTNPARPVDPAPPVRDRPTNSGPDIAATKATPIPAKPVDPPPVPPNPLPPCPQNQRTVTPVEPHVSSRVGVASSTAGPSHSQDATRPPFPDDPSLIPVETIYPSADTSTQQTSWISKYAIPKQYASDPVFGRRPPAFRNWRQQVWLAAAAMDAAGNPTVRLEASAEREEKLYTLHVRKLQPGEWGALPKWVFESEIDYHRHIGRLKLQERAGAGASKGHAREDGAEEDEEVSMNAAKRSAEQPPEARPSKKQKGPSGGKVQKEGHLSKKEKREAKERKKRDQAAQSDPPGSASGMTATETNPSSSVASSPPPPQAPIPSSAKTIPVASSSSHHLLPTKTSPASSKPTAIGPTTQSSAVEADLDPAPSPPKRSATAADSSSDQDLSLSQLEDQLFANLEKIDRWTHLIADYPSRAQSVRKQVERVEVDIFKLQAEISRRKRSG